MKENLVIEITVEGGIIQHIDNIPNGITVRVRDFDVEGTSDPDDVKTNEAGERYIESDWTALSDRKSMNLALVDYLRGSK